MNSNMYKVPHLENNSYLYANCPFNTSIINRDSSETKKIANPYKDELDLAGYSKYEYQGKVLYAADKKGAECFSSETFNSKPLTEIKMNFESYPGTTGNFKDDEKYSKPSFQPKHEVSVNKENFLESEKLQVPLKKPGILKNLEKNLQENYSKNDEGFVLPSFRSENFYGQEVLNKETFADSLLNELEKSRRLAQENLPQGRDWRSHQFKPAKQLHRPDEDLKKHEKFERFAEPVNHLECSHSVFSSFSRASENSSQYEDQLIPSKPNSGYSQQVSSRKLRPTRDIWQKQVEKSDNFHQMLDFSKLDNRFRSASNKSSSKVPKSSKSSKNSKGSRCFNSFKGPTIFSCCNSRQPSKTSESKKTPRSACNSKERSSAEKEVFVEVMMKVLRDHAKNCKALRHEIDRVKYSKFFDVV